MANKLPEGFPFELGMWLTKFAEKMDSQSQSKKILLENSKEIINTNQVFKPNQIFISDLLTDLLNLQFIIEEFPKDFGLHLYNTTHDNSYLQDRNL